MRPPTHPRSIDVISPAFDGKSAVERQRMVYKAIWAELQARAGHSHPSRLFCCHPHTTGPAGALIRRVHPHRLQEAVHAVDAMTTKTPAEAGL